MSDTELQYPRMAGPLQESSETPLSELQAYLLALDQKSDILSHLPMAAYVIRADGVVIWYNARAAELWGRKPAIGDTDERFCGAHTLYRADGSHMAHCDTPVALALSTGASVHEEEVIIGRPDGSRVHVSVHIDPIRNPQDGQIIGVVNFFTSRSQETLCGASGSTGRTGIQSRAAHNRSETPLFSANARARRGTSTHCSRIA